MPTRNRAASRDEELQWVNVRRRLPRGPFLVALTVVLTATAACSDSERPPGTGEATPNTEIQATPSPDSGATSSTGVLVMPDADDLLIPTVSERELDVYMRHFSSEVPLIRVKGSSIIYRGETNRDGHDALIAHAKQGNASELVITSPGGSVYWGIKIGEIVYENGWDVRVRGLCIATCANYIFPVGRNKVIEDGGVVGWHGSTRRYHFVAERQGISLRQAILNSFSFAFQQLPGMTTQEESNETIARTVAEHETLIELERAFYERTGVDADIPVYGHLPQRYHAIQGSGGWTFTLEGMAKFGLDDITYEGSDAYPSDEARAQFNLVLIEVDDR